VEGALAFKKFSQVMGKSMAEFLCLGRNLHAFPRLACLSINKRSEIRIRAAPSSCKAEEKLLFLSSIQLKAESILPLLLRFFLLQLLGFKGTKVSSEFEEALHP
jgi:hypothetical protein